MTAARTIAKFNCARSEPGVLTVNTGVCSVHGKYLLMGACCLLVACKLHEKTWLKFVLYLAVFPLT